MVQNNFANFLDKLRTFAYSEFGFGPHLIAMRHIINFFKCLTFLWVILLMKIFNNYSTGMYFYLFLHGSYGWFWCIKEIFFPDATFKIKVKVGSMLLLTTVLALYWVIPYTIAAGYGIQQPSVNRMVICSILYIGGVILMMGSDHQKTKTLAVKKGLISTGFFAKTRNPNYLGEIMIYQSFAIATGYWLSFAIVLFVQLTLFAINIYLKDELSYKKKQGWENYKKQSYILMPKLFDNLALNILLYAAIFSGLVYLLK